MHLRKLQYRKFKIRQVGLVKTNTDMVKEAFDKTLVEHKRLLGKKPGFFGSWATLDMSQSHACITRFCFNYWCFNPGLTKQQAYDGACTTGRSFAKVGEFKGIVQRTINEQLEEYWTEEVKKVMKNAQIYKGKADKDLGIPGYYYRFHNNNYCLKVLAEFLTTRNYKVRHADASAQFKTWLKDKATKGNILKNAEYLFTQGTGTEQCHTSLILLYMYF